ncbi:MAG: PLP-dependent aminotransferase family protein [Reyranellaceae bacterium]
MSERIRMNAKGGRDTTAWIGRVETLRGPRYLAILACLEDAIKTGELPPQTRLPPQRQLATLLGLTVGTAGRAYAIAAERGLITGETGRGTFVSDNPFGGGGGAISPLRGALADVGRLRAELPVSPPERQMIDLALPAAPAPQVSAIVRDALRELADSDRLLGLRKYVTYRAAPRHAQAAARWIAGLGVEADASRIVVVASANQGLAAAILGNIVRGESVLTDALTYPGLKVLAFNYGWRLEPLERDDEGILPDALERAALEGRGRIVYLQSELHNPTAAVMRADRRRLIAEIARRYDLVLIDDHAALSELTSSIAPLAAIAPERTFAIFGAGKSVSASVPAGYIVTPPGWGQRFEQQVRDRYFHLSPLGPEIVSHLIESGAMADVARAYRAAIAGRLGLLRTHLPQADFTADPRAFFVWLRLPPHWHSADFASAAALNGFTVAAAANFAVGMTMRLSAVRLSLLGAPSDEIFVDGLTRLRSLMMADSVTAGVII